VELPGYDPTTTGIPFYGVRDEIGRVGRIGTCARWLSPLLDIDLDRSHTNYRPTQVPMRFGRAWPVQRRHPSWRWRSLRLP